MALKKIEVGAHTYEITSEYIRTSEDVFSCTSDCLRCGKLCEHGIATRELLQQ